MVGQKVISVERILELISDPQFHLLAGESPWAYEDEINAVNDYLRAVAPAVPEYVRATAAIPQTLRIVGTRTKRVFDPTRLTGQAKYSADIQLAGMLHAALLRSPYAHAVVDDIDTSAAAALPGVHAVLTFKDVADTPKLASPPDRFVLNQEVHFAGEEVAAVAAEDLDTAREAVSLIKVTWRELPQITSPEAALDPQAPNLAGGAAGPVIAVGEEGAAKENAAAQKKSPNSIALVYPTTDRGSFDAAYARAAVTHEGTYRTATVQHATMEPRTATVRWDGPDQLTAWVGTQDQQGVRRELAAFFKLPASHVRVISEFMGGGFGDKSSSSRHGRLAALLARKTQRPVRLAYDRPGNFKGADHRFATTVSLKAGVSPDGKLLAYRADGISDSGAYPAPSLSDLMVSLVRLYHVENAHFEHQSVLTNRGPSGFQRCVGNPQGTFAQEVFMDELAEKAGIDPLKFRLMNVETQGDQDRKLPWASCGIVEAIQKGSEAIGWQQKWHAPGAAITNGKAHGIGLAAHACSHGSMTMPMVASVKINIDGSLDVISPSTEIGDGQSTTMMMIGAETVGVKLEQAHPSMGNTEFTGDSAGSNGSRQTISAGSAVVEAGLDLKAQILAQAAKPLPPKNQPLLDAKPEDLDTGDGFVFLKADPSKRVAIADVVASTGGPMMGRGAHTIPPGIGMSTFAAGFAEVEVDTDTGEVTLTRYVGVNDLGRAVNPLGAEQQMEGAFSMSYGMALGEEVRYDPQFGFPVMWNWENYAMPTALDHPTVSNMVPLWVEPIDKVGPYGAKGLAEPPTSPPAPAIANAIYNAIGVRIHETPITRDKVLAALRQKQSGKA